MKYNILFVESNSGLVKSIEPLLEKHNVDYVNNSDLENKLVIKKTETKFGYSVNYKLNLEKIKKYDIIFVDYKPASNKGLTLALILNKKANRIYVMSHDTLHVKDLLEQNKITGIIHKNGNTIERILELIH